MGGLKRVLLANTADVTAITVTANIVTAITMDAGKKFKEYFFSPETSSFNSTYQVNRQNGSQYIQTLLTMVFNRLETSKRLEIMAIAQADLYAIAETMDGKFWMIGREEALGLNAGESGSGTARGDRNGYSITLEENSLELPIEVDDSIISGIL